MDNNYLILEKGKWTPANTNKTISISGPFFKNKFIYHFENLNMGTYEIPEGIELEVIGYYDNLEKLGIIGPSIKKFTGKKELNYTVIAMRNTILPENLPVVAIRAVLAPNATIWQRIKWLFTNTVKIKNYDTKL